MPFNWAVLSLNLNQVLEFQLSLTNLDLQSISFDIDFADLKPNTNDGEIQAKQKTYF